MPPAKTGELEFAFQSTGAVDETAGCCIRADIGIGDWDATDDNGDATLMTGCGTVTCCDVVVVSCDEARCDQQTALHW